MVFFTLYLYHFQPLHPLVFIFDFHLSNNKLSCFTAVQACNLLTLQVGHNFSFTDDSSLLEVSFSAISSSSLFSPSSSLILSFSLISSSDLIDPFNSVSLLSFSSSAIMLSSGLALEFSVFMKFIMSSSVN